MQILLALSVAPLVGAWIEILQTQFKFYHLIVAPLVGAWIEMIGMRTILLTARVAPLVGAWIEIEFQQDYKAVVLCRSSRRSVD